MQETGGIDANGDSVADAAAGGSTLIDSDGHGVPHYRELPEGVDPVTTGNPTAPVEPFTTEAEILKGLSGTGCAIPDLLIFVS